MREYIISCLDHYTHYTSYTYYGILRRGYMPCYRCILYCNLGLVVSTVLMWLADSGSRSEDGGNHWISKWEDIILVVFAIIRIIRLIHIMSQVDALLKTLELQESAQRKGHFALFNCLVLGHTKYKGVQRVYCNPFPTKMFHGSHRMDLVMIRDGCPSAQGGSGTWSEPHGPLDPRSDGRWRLSLAARGDHSFAGILRQHDTPGVLPIQSFLRSLHAHFMLTSTTAISVIMAIIAISVIIAS